MGNWQIIFPGKIANMFNTGTAEWMSLELHAGWSLPIELKIVNFYT
jgi:hypothetical protein